MDLKPFMSSSNIWRKHFEDSSKTTYNKRFRTVQEGSGFPSNNLVTVSPTKQAEDIAKSEIVEINRVARPAKSRYKKRAKKPKVHSRTRSRTVKSKGKRKAGKRTLSHRRKKKK